MQIDVERLMRILPTVQKPGRYVGGEVNSVVKDWNATPTRVCLGFPDVYDLGMSSLGVAILYDTLNGLPGVLAERAYMPWVDMLAAMREAGIPLYSLESKRALSDFDLLGFSLPSEQLYTNVLEMLDLAGLPVLARERDGSHPLVVAGGHAAFNPEPMADFVDAFVIGDGEEAVVDVVRAYEAARGEGREAQLQALARVPGVYVPRFYDVRYGGGGAISVIEANAPEAALPVLKRVVSPLPPPPTRLLVPHVDVIHNRAAIEIQRGCSRGCRFCHAGMVVRPVRERPVGEILEALDAILSQTGFEEVGLLSLSSSDHTGIDVLVRQVIERHAGAHLSIALPALRADSFSVGLAEAIAQGRRSGFTFAPEAAGEGVKARINKSIANDHVLDVAQDVFGRGWRTVKLYFLIGLPGEKMPDVQAIIDLVRAVRARGRKAHGPKARVNVSVNVFIPKPHTPFQWAGLDPAESIRQKQALLRRELREPGLDLSYSDAEGALLEAALSRGDRRLGDVILRAWELGARFDGWDEQRDPDAWAQAFAEADLRPEFYACRERPPDERLPWDVVSTGVDSRFLLAEYERSRRGETSADCRERCHSCGVLTAYREQWSESWCCPEP